VISPREILGAVKPTEAEIKRLAIDEADPLRYARFEPIARGPLFGLCALALVGLAALPSSVFRAIRGALRSQPPEA
jgi:hypothetical protein